MKIKLLFAAAVAIALPAAAQAQDCDRECLIAMADAYAAALVAHDPSKVPLATDVVTVENTRRIGRGEGLWRTATGGVTEFRVPVPEDYADSRGRLIHIGKSYYDSLDLNNGAMTPFADDCERRENGFQTARNPMTRVTAGNGQTDPAFAYLGGLGCAAQMNTPMWEDIDTIENRRVEIADTVTGLVWGHSHFHHDMKEERYKLIGVPGIEYRVIRASTGAGFDMPAIHIYKVWGGQMHEIEAMGIVLPYMSPTGWE